MANVAETLLKVVSPIQEDLMKVDQCVVDDLQSNIPLIKKISDYVVTAGGKRVRPILLLLIARALGYKGDGHVFLATMIEYIHTASLLHDDVVDESDLRRGKPTASFKWGNSAAVLTGDFMYSRAFELMVKTKDLRICEIVAGAVNRISEGEVIQLLNVGDASLDETRYLDVIERKTGVLFEAAARMAATIAKVDKETEENVAKYALCLGRAFQIVDDVLDYSGTKKIGKNLGGDLKERKMTMPLIFAIRNGTEEEANLIRRAISEGNEDYFEDILKILKRTNALEACLQMARDEVSHGVSVLSNIPSSIYKNSLIELLALTVDRDI